MAVSLCSDFHRADEMWLSYSRREVVFIQQMRSAHRNLPQCRTCDWVTADIFYIWYVRILDSVKADVLQ